MSERLENLKSYLAKNGFRFSMNPVDFKNKTKIIFSAEKSKKNFLVYFLLDLSNDLISRFENEIKAFEFFASSSVISCPEIIYFDQKNYWLIREEFQGDATGNVYFFNAKCQTDNFIRKLSSILEEFVSSNVSVAKKDLTKIMIKKITFFSSDKNINLDAGVINNFCNQVLKSKTEINNPKFCHFVHGDLQPTNILTAGSKISIIDFEQSSRANILYDFASLYHRAELNPNWQKRFLDEYKKMLLKHDIEFSPSIFGIFYRYFLLSDVATLVNKYLLNKGKKFHGTASLDQKLVKQLIKLYLEKFTNIRELIT